LYKKAWINKNIGEYMHKIKLLLLISISVLAFSNLTAQTTNPNCKWVGNVSASFSNPSIPQRNELLIGNVVFEYDRGEFGNGHVYEVYKLTGGKMIWSVAGGTMPNECSVKNNSISFSWDSVQVIGGELIIYENGYYNGSAANQDLSLNFTAVHTDCKNYSSDEPPLVTGVAIGNPADSSFIQDDVMTGSVTETFYTWSWNLHKESGEEVKLQVESPIYDNWLPSAGKNEDEYGALIPFYAKLVEPDGSTACEKAKKFVFQLINVSKEPGVALNFPDKSKAKNDYDIHFLKEFNGPKDIMSADRLSLETKGGSEAFAVVLPFDWGGYADLKVTAYMQNDDTLTGFLTGHPEITEIPIPKRSGNSKVADKWKENKVVTNYLDDHDEESEPTGDGHNGDGFTLYEEYRGFYENGNHISGDPKRKDLFIHTSIDRFKPEVQFFKSLTRLNIHYNLNSDEFDTDTRLINFNHKDAPHETDQHGLFVDATSNLGKSYSPIGPPKYVDTVSISIATDERNLRQTIAHELGHSVHILHHGPDIDKSTTWSTLQIEELLVFTEDGLTVDARWESDNRPYSQIISGNGWVGHEGGQHSGFSRCIMRYHIAFAYIPGSDGTSNIRYITGGNETPGYFLCDKKEDNPGGFNHTDRNPRPRYGPAVNGNCRSQICINDKYH
jgi:hypothetical protein